MPSKDILDRLFGVERRAEALVAEAADEAARRVSSAKEAAEAAFREAYEARAKRAEEARLAAEAAAAAEHDAALAEYRARLEGSRLDAAAFAAACERFVAGLL